MNKRPYFPFYPGDWFKDSNLAMCSLSTRGVWIEILAAIHDKNMGGKITGSLKQLSRICRCTEQEIECAINELKDTKTANVTVCNGNVTVMSRRLKREMEERESTRIRVQKHRDRKKSDECNADVTSTRARSVSFSYSNTDTNTNKDKEKINKKESVDLSRQSMKRFEPNGQEYLTQAKYVLSELNRISGNHIPERNDTLGIIEERLRDGVQQEELIAVVSKKKKDPNFGKNFLRPQTLFKKENYYKYLDEDENEYVKTDTKAGVDLDEI